ncbi:MAG: UDP-N-acetylmuramoyl-tripeptide--D-alanyl-D-alanine ligase [Verrucomicrobiales bacterium]|nr:UDP-N-acetylmuramoyl-tripeptide--D-alanyl-D-alanine ligase [Verrucomicrobiales bacterium]
MMEPLTLQRIAECVGGELSSSPATTVRRVVTDSRQVRPGDLFVALAGERFDGHAFLGPAFEQGAVAAMGEHGRCALPLPDRPLVQVRSSREALGRLAAAYRRDFQLPVIAVAGSNGKTTVKETLATVLRRRLRTLASAASFNNDIGVPLTLLELEREHRVAVVEAGTNHPGELAALLRLIEPRYGVLTSLGREHLEFFGNLAGVVEEEGCLAEAVHPEGCLFVNADVPGVDAVVRRTRARVVRVGWKAGADWRVVEAGVHETATRFRVEAPQPEFSGEYAVPLLGVHQVVAAALTVAVAAELGLSPVEVTRGLAGCSPAPHRLQARAGGDVLLLDDTYNANLDSVRAALETLRDVAGERRKVAILGDMAELGAASEADHAAAGEAAAFCGVDLLIALGARREGVAGAAREAGVPDVRAWATPDAAGREVAGLLQPGDVVLLKASRASRLERLVESLEHELAAPRPADRH